MDVILNSVLSRPEKILWANPVIYSRKKGTWTGRELVGYYMFSACGEKYPGNFFSRKYREQVCSLLLYCRNLRFYGN